MKEDRWLVAVIIGAVLLAYGLAWLWMPPMAPAIKFR